MRACAEEVQKHRRSVLVCTEQNIHCGHLIFPFEMYAEATHLLWECRRRRQLYARVADRSGAGTAAYQGATEGGTTWQR